MTTETTQNDGEAKLKKNEWFLVLEGESEAQLMWGKMAGRTNWEVFHLISANGFDLFIILRLWFTCQGLTAVFLFGDGADNIAGVDEAEEL